MQSDNPFRALWALGYRDLLPVIPPNAKLRPRSHISSLGKSPGLLYSDGLWGGMVNWTKHVTTEADLDQWGAMGASVGLRRGQAFLLDIDAYDEATAALIEAKAIEMLGPAPCRVGQWPKRGLLYRTDEDMAISALRFVSDGGPGQIEIPFQAVVAGIHAKTGKPYQWPRAVVPFADLSLVTRDDMAAFMADMRRVLPQAEAVGGAGIDKDNINQTALRGDPDLLEDALAFLPNEGADYHGWVKMAAACRAAFEDYGRGFDAFMAWSDKADIANPTENPAKMYSGLGPRFAVGAEHILSAARKSGWTGDAMRWLEPAPGPSLFPENEGWANSGSETAASYAAEEFAGLVMGAGGAAPADLAKRVAATPYRFPEPDTIPKRDTLYGGHYVRQFVSVTVAPSKVGKSSLIIAEALAMASGKPILGAKVAGPLRVWMWNGEDPIEELERRIAATMLHYGLTRDDVGDRLFVDSGRTMEIVLAADTRDGARIAAPVVGKLAHVLRENAIDVMQVDPFVSSHRVSENDNGAIDLVAKQWARIADRIGCAVELVHHVRKLNGGEITVEDGRGAVALLAASRSARALARMTASEGVKLGLAEGTRRRLFRFADTSSNLGLPAGEGDEWLELRSVALGNGPVGVDGADRWISGDQVGVACRWDGGGMGEASGVADDTKERALRLIAAGEWRRDIRAGDAWVGVPVAQAMQLDLDDEKDKGRVRQIVHEWIKSGVLNEVSRPDAHRKMRAYVVANLSRLTPDNVLD